MEDSQWLGREAALPSYGALESTPTSGLDALLQEPWTRLESEAAANEWQKAASEIPGPIGSCGYLAKPQQATASSSAGPPLFSP